MRHDLAPEHGFDTARELLQELCRVRVSVERPRGRTGVNVREVRSPTGSSGLVAGRAPARWRMSSISSPLITESAK